MIKIENAQLFGKVVADAVVAVDTNSRLNSAEKISRLNAIAKAAARMTDLTYSPFMEYFGDSDEMLIWNTVTNGVYTVKGYSCRCAAGEHGRFCWHIAVKRIYEIYLPMALKEAFEKQDRVDANRRQFGWDEVQQAEVAA